jgi:hypothetical protein
MVSLVRVNRGGVLMMDTGSKIAGNTKAISSGASSRDYGNGGLYAVAACLPSCRAVVLVKYRR